MSYFDNLHALALPVMPSTTAVGRRGAEALIPRPLHSALIAEGAALRLMHVCGDLASALYRFAARQSFSVDCGGGGRESNAHLVPGLLGLAAHLAGLCPDSQLQDLIQLALRHMGGSSVNGVVAGGSDAEGGGHDGLWSQVQQLWSQKQQQQGSTDSGCSSGAGGDSGSGGLLPSWPAGMALGLVVLGWQQWCDVRASTLAQLMECICRAQGVGGGDVAASARLAAVSSSPPGIAAVRLFALVDWLHLHLQQPQGPGQAVGASQSDGATGSSNQAAGQIEGGTNSCRAHVGALKAKFCTLQQLHSEAHQFLAQLAKVDGAGDHAAAVVGLLH